MTPVLDLLDSLHDHDHQTRSRRTRVYVAVLASCLVLGAWGDGSMRRHDAHTPQVCAARLHIAYDRENGATERLVAFQACVEGR